MIPNTSNPGISERIKATAKLSIDKLPVLNTVFENMAAPCAEQLRDYCSAAFSAFVNKIVSGDSWDLLESLSDSISVVFYCREWDARIVIGLERRFVFAIIEAMFGGEGTELPFEAIRPFTSLEMRIGRIVCEIAAKALESAFGTICEVSLEPERTEASLEFMTLGQSSMIMIHAEILFQVLDHGGLMFILIPQSSMQPIRQKLGRERKPVPSPNDPRWMSALNYRISNTEVSVEAVLDGKKMELSELLRLKAGNTIELSGTDQNVILECEGDPLFRGHLGQSRGFFSVTIDAPIGEGPSSEFHDRNNAGLLGDIGSS
ncbi:MAG: flagellar motor switch protein FliM [Rhodomicrobium sp.]